MLSTNRPPQRFATVRVDPGVYSMRWVPPRFLLLPHLNDHAMPQRILWFQDAELKKEADEHGDMALVEGTPSNPCANNLVIICVVNDYQHCGGYRTLKWAQAHSQSVTSGAPALCRRKTCDSDFFLFKQSMYIKQSNKDNFREMGLVSSKASRRNSC